MLTDTNTYNRELLNHTELQNITEQQIQQELQKYLNKYKPCFTHNVIRLKRYIFAELIYR